MRRIAALACLAAAQPLAPAFPPEWSAGSRPCRRARGLWHASIIWQHGMRHVEAALDAFRGAGVHVLRVEPFAMRNVTEFARRVYRKLPSTNPGKFVECMRVKAAHLEALDYRKAYVLTAYAPAGSTSMHAVKHALRSRYDPPVSKDLARCGANFIVHVTDDAEDADDVLNMTGQPPRASYALPAGAPWFAAGRAAVVNVGSLRVPCPAHAPRCAAPVPLGSSPAARGADAYEDSFRKAVEAGAVEDATTPRAFGLLAAAVVNASYVDDACGCDGVVRRRPVVVRGDVIVARPHRAALVLRARGPGARVEVLDLAAASHRMRRTLLAAAVVSDERLDRFCDAPFDEARFVDRARLSPLGPRTGVVLTVDAATDTRTRRRVVLKAGATFADHLAGDLLPALLNVSGEHVLTAEACFRRGARDRVAAYGKMDGNLLQLLVANDTGPLRQYVPRRRYRSCFALRAAHDLLRGLAAAHAAGIVNQDVHAGNLLFAGAGPAMRWKISDFGRACVVGAGRCPHVAGSRALAPEAGHVRKTPASDVWSAGFVFLLLRCGGDWGDRRALREWLLRLNEEYGATRKRLGGRDTTAVPIIAWNATSFAGLLRAAPPAIRNPAARCRLLARQAREKALPAARERALLAAMLDPRWEKRPAAEELAHDLGDLVSGRCGRLEGPVSD